MSSAWFHMPLERLRASFEHVSNDSYVQACRFESRIDLEVRVACPGTATSKAAANSSERQVPILIEPLR